MPTVILEDPILDTDDPYTRLLLLAEYWKNKYLGINEAIVLLPIQTEDLRGDLTYCRDKFSSYVEHHKWKVSYQKAEANSLMVELCDSVLTFPEHPLIAVSPGNVKTLGGWDG